MIRSLLLTAVIAFVAAPAGARAEDAPPAPAPAPGPAAAAEEKASAPPDAEVDTSIERFRTPVEALTERMVGSASKSVRFDWRNSTVGFGILGSELLERNNFGSTRVGGFVRKAFGSVIGELGVTRAFTWGTESTSRLSLTPYRQAARPSRWEIDLNLAYPVAEGVVTSMPGFLPPAELVFAANAGVRYLVYPDLYGRKRFVDVARALASPRLTDWELTRLEAQRLPAMELDPARYGVLAGLSLDVYFQPGAVISPRALISVPLFTPVNGSRLGLWWELSLGLGWTL